MFSDAERELLRQVASRDQREEGPEVKWLVRAYAEGVLVPKASNAVDEFMLRDSASRTELSNMAVEIARLRDLITQRLREKKP